MVAEKERDMFTCALGKEDKRNKNNIHASRIKMSGRILNETKLYLEHQVTML